MTTIASDDTTTDEDTLLVVDVVANDFDIETAIDPSTVTVTGGPAGGTAVANGDGTVTYTPAADVSGTDGFAYTVDNTEGITTAAATVTVAISPVNDPPVTQADSAETAEDTAVVIDILANDSDIDDAIDVTSLVLGAAGNGTVADNGDGSVTYTPNPNVSGTDTFSYTVADSQGAQSSSTQVTIDVASENDFPVAENDVATTDEDVAVIIDVLANDTDVEGGLVEVADGDHTAQQWLSGKKC